MTDLTKQLTTKPKAMLSAKPSDLLSQMIQIGRDRKLPVMETILDSIARLERRAGISINDYLDFGNKTDQTLKYQICDEQHLIGEFNSRNKLHGRGIKIHSNGFIFMQYWDSGDDAPGKHIYIDSDCSFFVGEIYLKDKRLNWEGTNFLPDGTTRKY